ncbi:MAG: hypothetical protein HBSAPP02_09120 [Phycisphaerae bacterium]|nr:MAG: pilus assembly protein PilM [Planctomycetia bacterium]RIK71517.1 MAG: hypothetical protein DCC66_00850 [Planctomycetota bacterium]GJQ25880.1 MAG: hypothetical protein HBSAPP02_09120 [Phycisphaerae bacterium]
MAIGLSSKKILAVEWDLRSIRMVLARPKADGVELLKAVSAPIPSTVSAEDAASLGAFIKESISSARIGVTRAILCIPRDQVVLNTINLPPTPGEEMAALVQFQVSKELPFAAEQAVLDFAVAGTHDPKAPCSVLATAIRRELLEFYQNVASAAGLTIERVGLRPLANLIALTASTGGTGPELTLLVDVGPHRTEIDLIRGGVLVFSRAASMSVGMEPATVNESGEADGTGYQDSRIISGGVDRDPVEANPQAVSALLVEVIRSFEAFRATEPSASLDRIVVAGSSGLEPQLAQMLGARFATRAELFSPEKALGLSAERARELRGFCAALGLAIGHSHDELALIDFLHPKRPVTKRELRLKKVPSAVMAAILLIGSIYLFQTKYVVPLRDEIRALEKAQSKLKVEEKLVREFAEKVDALEGWIESEQHWPSVIAALTAVFPPDREAYATRLDLELVPVRKSVKREATAKIKFRTASLGTVNELAEKLRAAGFENVVPGKETPTGGRDVYRNDTGIDAIVPQKKWSVVSATDATGAGATQEEVAPPEAASQTPGASKGEPARSGSGSAKESAGSGLDSGADAVKAGGAGKADEVRPGAAGRANLPSPTRPPSTGGRS